MGKKKTLSTLSSLLLGNTELMKSSSSSSSSSLSSWPWPSCHQPRTLSFRANNNKDSTTFKTINNSAYLDATNTMDNMLQTSESFFTVSPNTASFEEQESKKLDSIETVIRGSLRADRLFFEPDETKSIYKVAASAGGGGGDDDTETEITSLPFNDSVVLSMESQDPYVDFRKSMEEMVAAHDVKEWECLQELLCWYLKVNDKTNHGYILAAFVDLLVALAFASASSFSNSSYSSSSYSFSPSSPLSFYSSSMSSSHCVSCLEPDDEDKLIVDTDTPPKDETSTSTQISSLCSSSSSSCT